MSEGKIKVYGRRLSNREIADLLPLSPERQRERDSMKIIVDEQCRVSSVCRELREQRDRLERELDEVREKLADWENSAAHVEADHPDEVHCSCVPILRKLLCDARLERDEAVNNYETAALREHRMQEQRDRLAEVLGRIAALYESKEMTGTVDQRIADAYDMRCMARAALAAVKGGEA